MLDISGMNPPQRKAVETLKGPLMIIAGAGTGKTRVITYRIANLLSKGVKPGQITAVTFTNKAATEMKERLASLVSQPIKDINIGTFHSFCLKLLRRFHKAAGLQKQFNIVGTGDQLDLVQLITRTNNVKLLL